MGVIVHRESKTFELRSAAEKWARAREVDLENPTALIKAAHGAPTLANLIKWYFESFKHIANWQRTKTNDAGVSGKTRYRREQRPAIDDRDSY